MYPHCGLPLQPTPIIGKLPHSLPIRLTSLLVKPILFDQHFSIYHKLRSMRWIMACREMLVPPTTTRS